MKAWVLHDVNDFRLENIEKPEPGKREVLVEVRAAGICGSDIPRVYQNGTYSFPLVLGHEFSGVVTETGEDADAGWIGKRVGVFPLIPCGKCIPCRQKRFEMCRSYGYLGSRRDGGFAEYVRVPEENLIELPENVSFEAAAMLEPMAVAVHSIRRASLSSADTVAVWGLGTIGLLLLMFLKDAGIENVFVIGNKESQRQVVRDIGLNEDYYCDGRAEDTCKWLQEHTENRGADVFFECVGKNETMAKAIECAAPGGKVVLVGNPFSDMTLEKAVYWKILRNQLNVAGTWNSSFTREASDDWHYVIDKVSRKRVIPEKLISHHFSLEEVEKGFRLMRDKTEDYVKVMGILEK